MRNFLVSIPDGKGKGRKIALTTQLATLYQFPMGKVKQDMEQIFFSPVSFIVSIPDGKGKEPKGGCIMQEIFMYQFPMGKVKKNWEKIGRSIFSINSQWER